MTILSDEEFTRRALEIEWLLLDVDGVLTDGGLYYDRRGHRTLRFHVRDGLALRLAQRAGLKIGVLSGRGPAALDRRAAELDLDLVLKSSRDKGADFETFLAQRKASPRQIAFIGDDLPDLRILGRCGLSFAPADAVEEVRAVVHRVLSAAGGKGAVREMIEGILRARGAWEQLIAPFTFES